MVSVGTIIWLSSELMFFATLFASYFTIRAVSPELWSQATANLNVPFASVNTTILVASSFTCQMGVFAAEAGRVGRTFVARRFTHEQAVTAIVVSYYWHFVDVVWIGLFATIYLIK
jgi:heme/copper-type cytochrome/quinol oxidase subunit 3